MSHANILAPHLDDAVLSCWSKVQAGSHVITMFAGNPPNPQLKLWDFVTGIADSQAAHDIRIAENDTALVNTGSQTTNLEYLDFQYTHPARDIKSMASAVGEVLVPQIPIVAAAGIGRYLRNHPDHKTTRKVGKALLEDGHNVTFYADIPYMLPARNFEEWPSRLPKDKISRALGIDVEIEQIELDDEQRIAKQQAVKTYKTQYKMVNALAFGALGKDEAYRWEAIFRPV